MRTSVGGTCGIHIAYGKIFAWLRFDYVYKTLSFDTFTNAYIPRNANDEFCKLVFIFERAFIDTIIYFIRNMNLCMLQTFHIVFDIICQIQRRL